MTGPHAPIEVGALAAGLKSNTVRARMKRGAETLEEALQGPPGTPWSRKRGAVNNTLATVSERDRTIAAIDARGTLTRKQIAKHFGISPARVTQILNGRNRKPGLLPRRRINERRLALREIADLILRQGVSDKCNTP